MGQQLVMDLCKWNAVKILLIAHLNTTKFETHHSRIVTYRQEYITLAIFIGPSYTIERIVLMS